ncbi:MAG: preprotein translocase subunit YajC [Gammaproteobacteria bacterium]|nr:preprotein translocase subunit YajC [Gammaproteobacteria bacterium]MBK9427681.1 preprotein translocase subunit YajC [Gammaproteobacteria bacterium]
MSLFIPSAWAQAAPASEPNPLFTLVLFGGLFVFMYFVIIRPQQKRRKEQANLVAKLAKGDEVVTASGILGRITKIEGNFLVLEVSDKVELKFQREAIHAVLPKGTLKAL